MAARVGESLVRRRSSRLARPAITVDYDLRVYADLHTAQGLGLFRHGLRGYPELRLIDRLLEPGDTFVDAGAHIGLFALVAARRVGSSGRVIAFEPTRRSAEALRANAALNGFGWIDIDPRALADAEGQLAFVEFEGDGSGLSSFAPLESGGTSRMIDVTTLDAAIAPDGVRFLKLDIEGAEARALRGGEHLLARSRPDLLIEVEPAHLERQGSSPEQLDEILAHHDYLSFELWPGPKLELRRLASTAERRVRETVVATSDTGRLEKAGCVLH